MTSRFSQSWLQFAEYLLLMAACCSCMLPSITCQTCHYVPQYSAPVVDISTSPAIHSLTFAKPFNLTCTAKLTDNLRYARYKDSRPYSIMWFNSQGKMEHECEAKSPPGILLNCTLVVLVLDKGTIGNYTCQASNGYSSCTMKKIEIHVRIEIQRPRIVKAPLNQSASIGSNVTFNCAVRGHPKPNITWTKDNDSGFLQFNPRANVVTDRKKLYSQLVITGVKGEDYGKYQCVAKNVAGMRTSKGAFLNPGNLATESPHFVEVPLNHSASIGSNVTFNCTVNGHPKPTITWTKDNNSDLLQSNLRAKVITDNEKGHSQLVITGLESGDYGKYWCVARNNVGVRTSRVAFLSPGTSVPSPPRNSKSTPKALKVSSAKIIAIGVPCVVVLLIICGVGGCLWYWRSRRTGETNDREIPTVVFTSSDSVERTSLEVEVTSSEATAVLLQEKTENPYDIIDSPAPPIPVHAQESEKVQLLGSGTDLLSGAFRVDLSTRTFQKTRKLPPTPIEETPPRRPPKPTKKENTAPQIVCSCMLQARKQTPRLKKSDTLKSKDSGYDSTESSDSLSVDQEIALGGESCVNETVEGWEIDLERLEVLEEVLGEGEFGIVKKGRYRGEDEKIFDVAVKQLKDTSSMTDKADMLSEITILKQAGRHCNIVNLVGACTQKDKFLVVTELIPNGSLENFLKTKRIEHSLSEWNKYENVHFGLNDRQSLIIALQIASGMRHLEEKKCIHRDLAARNVFIDENNVAKVGDFGMARDISDDGIYTKTSSGKVPWRWLSLESLKDRVYTSRSDVWSFGIVLWEIATYGEEPYPDISSPAELITRLSSGFRMPRPDYCSDELYELMSSCWMENPLKRPTFVGITNQLKYYLREFKRRYENIEDDGICSDTEAR